MKDTNVENTEWEDFSQPQEVGTDGGNPENTPKKSSKKKAWKIVGGIGLSVALFVSGYLASFLQYDEELRALQKVKTAIDTQYYKEITDEEFYGAIFDTVNNKLLDPYSAYLTVDEYEKMTTSATGKWSGIGITFLTRDIEGNEQMLVRRVSGNSPAEKAGVQEGDRIVGYGLTAEELILSENYGKFYSFVQERATGEKFFLKMDRAGTGETLVEISKESFVESYVFYRTKDTSYAFTGANATNLTEKGTSLPVLGDSVAYIRLTQFNGAAAEEFSVAMNKFKQDGKTDLVLDLRENGGGYLEILQKIGAYFCKGAKKKALVAVAKYKNGSKEEFYVEDALYERYFSDGSRITVLADGGTASASECLLGCMLDYGAITYGDICLIERSGVAKTYGKGIMQSTFPFGLGKTDAVKLTTAEIFWPLSGNSIHGRGVLPEDGTKTVAENYEKDGEIISAINALYR